MSIRAFRGHHPTIAPGAYIDPSAIVIGDVDIGADASLWPAVVARGDINRIRIGARSNIQDGTVLHVTHDSAFNPGGFALEIGAEVTVGHQALLHGCTIEHGCLIGMGAIVMDGAVLHSGLILGAGSLVPPKRELEGGYLWLGRPVQRVRVLTDQERAHLAYVAEHYVRLKDEYRTAG